MSNGVWRARTARYAASREHALQFGTAQEKEAAASPLDKSEVTASPRGRSEGTEMAGEGASDRTGGSHDKEASWPGKDAEK